jgi:hypothetical protein
MRTPIRNCHLLTVVLAAIGLITGSPAVATSFWDFTPSTCGTINCSSIPFGGVVNGHRDGPHPWTAEFWAPSDACVRFEVRSSASLALVVTGKTGMDNYVGFSPEPPEPFSVRFNSFTRGWYGVTVRTNGSANLEAPFTLLFGVYNLGNVNCSPANQPLY